MKTKKQTITMMLLSLVCLMTFVAACSPVHHSNTDDIRPGVAAESSEHTEREVDLADVGGRVTVYSYYEIDAMEKLNIQNHLPAVEVHYVTVSADNAAESYMDTLESEDADIFILREDWIGIFNEMNVFEDIGRKPYLGEKLLQHFPDSMKMAYRSFDEQKLLALPISTDLMVTFYRHDVFEQANLPADPGTLADDMMDYESWIELAGKLKASNQWIIPWESEPLRLVTAGTHLFDRAMSYSLDRNILLQAIQAGRIIEEQELAAFNNIYIDSGKNDIREGKTVMFYTGMNFAEQLKQIAPELAGQWRMTALPFGLHALNHQDVVAMSSRSDNKAAAWAVMQLLTEQERNRMEQLVSIRLDPAGDMGDPYFGGQQIDVLQADLMEQLPEHKLTPIDEDASEILWDVWNRYFYETTIPVEDIAFQIEDEISRKLEQEIESLKEILAEDRK